MKTAFIAQARMTSSRLPGKVGMDIFGKTALERMIERMSLTRHKDVDIIIATTTNQDDDVVEEIATECGVKVFRGSENHVLSRYYYAAKEYNVDVISRVTCDDLLFDPRWLFDDMLDEFLKGGCDYISGMNFNRENNTWTNMEPCEGCYNEIFTFAGLEKCMKEATDPYCIEHVTPYFYMNPDIFVCKGMTSNYQGPSIFPDKYGTSLDTKEDLQLLRNIYEVCCAEENNFTILDVIRAYSTHPEWTSIIADISRTPVTYHGEAGKNTIWG